MRNVKLISKFKMMEENRVKKLCLILTLALVLVGAFSAVALADTTVAPLVTSPTVDRTHDTGYNGHGTTDSTVNAHGGFTVNGDTCSACHSMHYAGNGSNLTVQESTANGSMACLACHDGTTGNYNVIGGENGVGELAMGGLFANYGGQTPSGSMHDAFGSVEAYVAAPGGRGATPDAAIDGSTYDKGTWVVKDSSKLTCGSCHDAHIAINPRLLTVNPNGIMDDKVRTSTAATTAYNNKTAATYVADAATKYWFPEAPGSDIQVYVGTTELEYIKDYQVKWQTFDSAKNTKNDADSGLGAKVRDGVLQPPKPGYNSVFNEDHAYVVITKKGLSGAVTLSYKPAFTVQMKISQYNTTGETIQYGKGIENFCTACHTDFKGSKSGAGYFSGLYHHTGDRPNEDNVAVLGNSVPESAKGDTTKESIGSCLTCHFAHGTNQARWAEVSTKAGYLNEENKPLYDVAETAGSSAMKRLPNNAICVLCHDMVATNGSGNSKN